MTGLREVAEDIESHLTDSGREGVTVKRDTHLNGDALDIYGMSNIREAVRFGGLKSIHEAGYVVSNIKNFEKGTIVAEEGKVRVFLRNADEFFDTEPSERHISIDRTGILETILLEFDSRTTVRGDEKTVINFEGDLDLTEPRIQNILQREGALEPARAEGFVAGMFFAALMQTTGHVEEWAEFFGQ